MRGWGRAGRPVTGAVLSTASLWREECVLNIIMVMVAQLCEYTKKKNDSYFKMVGCTRCELYLNKAIIKKIDEI